MTTARRVALALLLGACSLGATSAHAQYPAPGGAWGAPEPVLYNGPAQGYDDPGYGACPPEQRLTFHDGLRTEVPDDGLSLPHPSFFTGGGFLRAEYLNYNISGPGDTLLGAPVLGNPDPSQPFVIFTPGTNFPSTVGRVPDLLSVDLRDTNGVRVSGGLELTHGDSIEISAFMLEQKKSGYVIENLGQNDFFFGLPTSIVTSVYANGALTDLFFIYNQRFAAIYQSQLWGAEGNYLIDYDVDGLLHCRPLVGLRYINLRERLGQYGVFQELAPVAPFETLIESKTTNHLGGGQIGTRIEFVTQLIEFGAEAKFMVLSNTMLAEVETQNVRFAGDPRVFTEDLTTQLAGGVDLLGWATLNVHPNMSLRIGYNFMYLANITRPEDNIYYNETGINNPAGIVVDMHRQDFNMYGVSLGADFRW